MARRWKLALLLLVLLLVLWYDVSPPGSIDTQARRRLAGKEFDFVGWEIGALLSKLAHSLIAPQRYMDESARHDFFLDYLTLVVDIQHLDWEIRHVYTDPAAADPEIATADQRARLTDLRDEQKARQLLAEAILEEQTACVLAEKGFGTLNQEIPPVGTHFTPLPLMVFVSPRDHIEVVFSQSLRHGLDTAQQEAIEEQIDADLDVSSLVTGIGGLAAYPAMMLESSSPTWVIEVTAHEWTHHYLTLRPLGWNYDASPESRTINETVASIVGKEVGRQMIKRYYPELLPPPSRPVSGEEAAPSSEPPPFNFRQEMRQTRVRVDELLAEGKIEEAEAYMEERRQVFVANGYMIRKLNQAYFAFHGSYADEPGAAGADPIGPAVKALRARSPDLYTFVQRIARITTLAELRELLQKY